MKIPDIPQDERARLETLRSLQILDTPPEERFDRLTRMAKRLFGVPIALVSLVDENRQWFKSCVGIDASETPRAISFCGHAILNDEVLVIPDAAEDERFADNPFVINDPKIRFYAGCPLRALNGLNLGTLCIVDQKPRNFETEDIETLMDLASIVERELATIEMATLDDLTNIANRRGFMKLAQQSLHFCGRHRIPAALVFLDLDKFKPINDTFGHAEGDRVLIAFANLMKSVCRNSDVLGRLGGDEFVILLAETSRQSAEDFIARFSQSLVKYNQDENRGYDIGFSYGIVAFNPEQPATIREMLADGDAQMYKLKHAKKLSEPSMRG